MSYDRQIEQVCPHSVCEELLFVDEDRQVIQPKRPIAAVQSVVVRVDGIAEIPTQGYTIPASIVSAFQEPYTIPVGQELLVVQVGEGSPQALRIPTANKMSTVEILDRLNRQVNHVVFEASGSRIRVRTIGTGAGAYFRFTSDSTLHSVLGFATDRVWRGQEVFPGWALIGAPRSLVDRPQRWIVFDSPLRTQGSFAEIDYTTVRQECRRCGGLGVENDWVYAKDGNVVEVWNEYLLIQELTKMTYTLQGSNPFSLWYGTRLLDLMGSRISSEGILQNTITSEITQAFRRWQSIKRQQETVVNQEVTDSEFPFQLLSIKVRRSEDDPTVLYVDITIKSRSNKPIQIQRGIRIPQPYDLLGSTTAQGVLKEALSGFSLMEGF